MFQFGEGQNCTIFTKIGTKSISIYKCELTNDKIFNILIFLKQLNLNFSFYNRKICLRVIFSEFWRLKNKSKTNIFISLYPTHYQLFQTYLSFSHPFIFFSLFLKPFHRLFSLSQTSSELLLSFSNLSASSFVSGSPTHHTMANTKSSASSLYFSLTQNTIFLILHTSLPFYETSSLSF